MFIDCPFLVPCKLYIHLKLGLYLENIIIKLNILKETIFFIASKSYTIQLLYFYTNM